jgi:hypothetical protein
MTRRIRTSEIGSKKQKKTARKNWRHIKKDTYKITSTSKTEKERIKK